jgi:hypothetical protein
MPPAINVGSRSVFVTSTAWVAIVLAGIASVSALLQNAAVASLAPGWALAGQSHALPAVVHWLIGYLPWLMGAGVLVSFATLAAAIGLLVRLNWARRTFIGLLALAIAGHLIGLWLQQEVMQSVVHETLSRTVLPESVMGVFGGFVTAARVMAGLLTLAACALLAWVMRRLMTDAVRREFA